MGVGPQDRIAILGYNSTRYFILDVAIGLLGAVSVPLYYTSPINEIKQIIQDSESKLLLLGTEPILTQNQELDLKIPIVSFARSSNLIYELAKNQSSDESNPKIIDWEAFLKIGHEYVKKF